jgi:hypothetical protein
VELNYYEEVHKPHLKHYAILRGAKAPPEELRNKNYSEEVCKPFLQD